MTRKQRIGRAFGGAAATYGDHAAVQRLAAERLADRVAALPLPERPRVLEVGCGAGFLTRALTTRMPGIELIASDLSPAMVQACREGGGGALAYLAMDGERPALREASFDLVCSGLALQWFEDPEASLAGLARLLKPGGWLAVSTLLSGTLAEWARAHADLGLESGSPDFAEPDALQQFAFEGAPMALDVETVVERHANGAGFVRALKAIGASTPRLDRRPLPARSFKRVLDRFESAGALATYRIGYGLVRRPARGRGVFVTGTDTDVGKTVVAACLARALGADYWKPVQTGAEPGGGDTPTVAALAALPPDRIHPPAVTLPAPLSPHAAASLAGTTIDFESLVPPTTARPLVVEGAGGAMVPLNGDRLMVDLMARLGLPVVVVARTTLGTINHTLLTLEALRARGIDVLGVIMNGPPSASNREAIERYGRTRVLAEIPWVENPTPEWVETVGRGLPERL